MPIIPIEQEFHVNDLTIRALRWSSTSPGASEKDSNANSDGSAVPNNSLKILCLHGWLDNAGSFAWLASELAQRGCECVALDLAGNGRSTHRSLHGSYHLWDDVLDIEAVLKRLGWQEYIVLGHSRGANVASYFAATEPAGLKACVMLDGIVPPQAESTRFVTQFKVYLDSRRQAIEKRGARAQDHRVDAKAPVLTTSGCLESFDSAWKKRRRHCELEAEEMQPLLKRALRQCGVQPDGSPCWRWTHDPRYLSRSMFRLQQQDRDSMLESMACPVLLILAEDGNFSAVSGETIEQLKTLCQDLTLDHHSGSHHFHMQFEHYLSLAERIREWLDHLG